MGMMLLRIKLFFHAFNPLVYSIFQLQVLQTINTNQDDNDQAFLIAR